VLASGIHCSRNGCSAVPAAGRPTGRHGKANRRQPRRVMLPCNDCQACGGEDTSTTQYSNPTPQQEKQAQQAPSEPALTQGLVPSRIHCLVGKAAVGAAPHLAAGQVQGVGGARRHCTQSGQQGGGSATQPICFRAAWGRCPLNGGEPREGHAGRRAGSADPLMLARYSEALAGCTRLAFESVRGAPLDLEHRRLFAVEVVGDAPAGGVGVVEIVCRGGTWCAECQLVAVV
jgi:hypothetical protein